MPQETPVTTVPKGQENQNNTRPNAIQLGGNSYSHVTWGETIDRWGRDGVSNEMPRSSEKFELDVEDKPDVSIWETAGAQLQSAQEVTEAPRELSASEQLEIAFNYLNDEQLLRRGATLSSNVFWMRRVS